MTALLLPRIACPAMLCLSILFLYPNLIFSSPMRLDLPTPSLTLNTSTSFSRTFDLTSLLPVPSYSALPVSDSYQSSNLWPETPFIIYDVRRHPSNPPWLEFFWSGLMFPEPQRTSMEWKLGVLVARFKELNETERCPSYESINDQTTLILRLDSLFTTIAQCNMILGIFDTLVEQFGVMEIKFFWGFGGKEGDKRIAQGSFHMALGTVPSSIS